MVTEPHLMNVPINYVNDLGGHVMLLLRIAEARPMSTGRNEGVVLRDRVEQEVREKW